MAAGLATITGLYEGLTTGKWLGILEAIGILIAVLIATGVSFLLEYQADRAFDLLKAEAENVRIKVTRDGKFQTIETNDLVAGDLVHLESGDKIPADGLLIDATNFAVDQSVWNGESVPDRKDPANNPRMIGSTDVVEGAGRMIAIAVGDNSERGKIAQKLGENTRERTPLEQRLDRIAALINVAGTTAAIMVFAAIFGDGIINGELGPAPALTADYVYLGAVVLTLVALFAYNLTPRGRKTVVRNNLAAGGLMFLVGLIALFVWGAPLDPASAAPGEGTDTLALVVNNLVNPILGYFMLAVTIVVVAVPEGLPMAITISLALSMRKIRQDNNLVRKMVATETLGSTNVICSDKTGTLTLNQMSVAEVYVHGQTFSARTDEPVELHHHPAFDKMALIAGRNSTAEIEERSDRLAFIGNHTEGALLKWMRDNGHHYHQVREEHEIRQFFPFNSAVKMMSTVTDHNGGQILLSKGAPERIMDRCSQVEIADGQLEPIADHRKALDAIVEGMASRAMRTLALAYRHDPHGEDPVQDMTLVAIFGIRDPIRPDVPAAIASCHEAQIEVKMVTGDHELTARVLAEQMGLMDEDSIVVVGSKFKEMSDEEIIEKLPRMRVMARFEPLDKERLVRLIQADKESVVAVTGDGTNDAPALKSADVGIAMGVRGTDIAKEASDIILTDDNFGSIVRAVHWGRTLYENVQKFLQFQLTINFSALLIAFLSPLFALLVSLLVANDINLLSNANFQELPLTILQLLWINLIMDTFAALALSLEPPRDEMMKEPPKSRAASFITRAMAGSILVTGLYFTFVLLFMQGTSTYFGVDASDPRQVSSVLFTTYVFMQVFNLINARSVTPARSPFSEIGKSRNFWVILALIVVIQVLLTTYGGATFSTAPLPLGTWIIVILIGSSVLVVGEVYRRAYTALFGTKN